MQRKVQRKVQRNVRTREAVEKVMVLKQRSKEQVVSVAPAVVRKWMHSSKVGECRVEVAYLLTHSNGYILQVLEEKGTR